MYVTAEGTMAWNSENSVLLGGLRNKLTDFVTSNQPNPFNTASSRYTTVHEAGHLVDFAMTRSLMRGKKEHQIEDAAYNGYGSDLAIRYTLTKLLKQGNRDAQEILGELQAFDSSIRSFKDLDLSVQDVPPGSNQSYNRSNNSNRTYSTVPDEPARLEDIDYGDEDEDEEESSSA